MLDISHTMEIFNPLIYKKGITIIGVGATGGNLAVALARTGVERLDIYDFDKVESHNMTNQVWTVDQIGMFKEDALIENLLKINPEMKITKHGKWDGQLLTGIVINAVDSMELRKAIYEANKYNPNIDLMIDPRLGVPDSQIITDTWDMNKADFFISQSLVKDDELDVVKSACGTPQNISTTMMLTVTFILTNIIKFIKGETFKRIIHTNVMNYAVRSWE